LVKNTSLPFDQWLYKGKNKAMRPATLTINLSHLIWNYRLLQQHAPETNIMAVVKANAYGHGLIPVSTALYQVGCRSFAVTDAEEGASLREHLNHDANIAIFSGVFDSEDANHCKTHQLSPVLTKVSQLELLKNTSFSGEVWLKVDTGMNRLGSINIQELSKTVSQLPHIQLAGIMSHLACADTPENPMNQQQLATFQTLRSQTTAPQYSLFNSAGSLAFSHIMQTDIIRPGIALFGMEPIIDKQYGFKPVADLSSQVIQLRQIKRGENVSYGTSWVAQVNTTIAVVALGYADGLPRILSNQGFAWCNGKLLPIVGKVCMDYCMLEVHDCNIAVGNKVVFFGSAQGQPNAQQVATQCQTISYEIFTQLGPRLNRQYVGEIL